MNTKQTHTAQQNLLFLALLQAEYAKQKQVNEELLNILLLVVYATRLCQNENCLPDRQNNAVHCFASDENCFSGTDASDENCCEFANANSIAQTAGTPFERYELNYNLDYEYDAKFVHRAKRIGKQHYLYDLNGNLISEQEGAYNEAEASSQHEVIQTGNLYSVDYGWGMVNPDATPTSTPNITRRNYTWNERNLLKTSTDRSYSVQYKYGADGQRSAKYSVGSNGVSETLYFNKMYNWRYDSRIMPRDGRVSKHIYLGETRILTKLESAGNDLSAIVSEELTKQYYYHTDHLGSAQLISDHDGKEYERIEYTPYGELWIEKKTTISQIDIPFRFTGKERDEETGLYYYGARYLDAKTSRWLSTDPALGEYIPQAPINDEAKKANGNLPGMGGVFNTVNSHLYHYAGNNPVKFIDPDGRSDWSNIPRTLKDVGENLKTAPAVVSQGVSSAISSLKTIPAVLRAALTDSEEGLRMAGSIALSQTPVVGDLKDIQEALTGTDLITGEKLSGGDRAITAVAAALPVVTSAGAKRIAKAFSTTSEATKAASALGFSKTNYRSSGQVVYKKGNKYISPDVDGHNGGTWKMADSPEHLGSRETRMGTYDENLNRIGD